MSIKIKQHDIRDCGAAYMASVAAHYKFKMPIARIRQYASTDKRGTNLLGLIQAAEKIGLSAKGVKGGMDALPDVPLPAIAHIVVKDVLHHFVVVYKVTKDRITVMDPAFGRMEHYTHEEWDKVWSGVLVLLAPNENFTTGNEKVSIYRRFWTLIRPHRSTLIQALFGAILFTIMGLSTAIYIGKITDFVLVDGNKKLLNLLGITMVVILLMQILIGVLKSVFVVQTGQQMDARLILGYYKHLLKLPQRFFDTMQVGEITSRIGDAVKIRAFINDVAIEMIVNVFIVFFSFALMFTYSWKLAMVMLGVIPMYTVVYFIANRVNRRAERKLMEGAADLETQLVESLNNIRTIKQFGVERVANLKTEVRFVSLMDRVYTSALNSVYIGNGSEFISRLFTIILLWVGSYFVISNDITPGELLSFYALIGYFTGPVSSLIGMNKTVQNALIAADRLFEIIDLEREEMTEKVSLTPEMIGDIRFAKVDFSYGTRVDVFEDFDVTISKGKTTAIIGESGSGKTTLISLLQNLYPIKSGSIKIGDMNIEHVSNDSLRSLVSVVPQKVELFTGSIIENIAIGDLRPDMERIMDICKKTGIDRFVEKLPNGYGAMLGENGANLSGGQRQRLAIARALYKDPEIIIMDEATSSLDSASEQYIQGTLSELGNMGKTIIIIAHRLSTIMHTDEIIVLEEGKVVQKGNHFDLIGIEGKYKELWDKQLPSYNHEDLKAA